MPDVQGPGGDVGGPSPRPTGNGTDRVTVKRDELDARVEELQTEKVWRRATWFVLLALVIIALAVAAAIYVAYSG
jgi:hypothetical protein